MGETSYKIVKLRTIRDYSLLSCRELRAKRPNEYFYCFDPCLILKGVKKFLYRLHTSARLSKIIRLPFQKIWKKYAINNGLEEWLQPDDYVCFIYCGSRSYADMGVFDLLKKNYPHSIFIYSFGDKVSLYAQGNYHFSEFCSAVFDGYFTYNSIDAEKYGLILTRPLMIDYSTVALNDNIPETDVFYIGQPKGRLEKIFAIYNKCIEKGLKCSFYLLHVPKKQRIDCEGIHYIEKYMPYEKMLEHAKRAKAILNIVQDGASGITLRDSEAIGMNKVLITNCDHLDKTEFYTPENIVKISNFDEEYTKILHSGEVEWNGKEAYSVDKYFEWLQKTINEIAERKKK